LVGKLVGVVEQPIGGGNEVLFRPFDGEAANPAIGRLGDRLNTNIWNPNLR